jgi:hypothetical protein
VALGAVCEVLLIVANIGTIVTLYPIVNLEGGWWWLLRRKE